MIKTPSNWQKRPYYIEEQVNIYGQINFHKTAINQVKKSLGKKCTFLSHLKEASGKPKFLAIIEVDGKLKKVRVDSTKDSFSDFVAEDYKALNELLHKYARGKETV